MSEEKRTGGCLCGKVSFTIAAAEPHVHACHCTICLRWNGGPGLSSSVQGVEFAGEEFLKVYESSAWAERGFCSECGANLFYRMKEGDMVMMSVGAFDDQSQFTLGGEIYVDEKAAHYDFAGDHPRLTAQEFLKSIGQG